MQDLVDSIRNITSALNGLKILENKRIEKNITDIQMETSLTQCLLPSDQGEFFKEWANEKSTSLLSSTVLESGDEDEAPINFNKTIAEEVDAGAMETKREFLTKFLGRKQNYPKYWLLEEPGTLGR